MLSFLKISRSTQRRIYWGCACGGALSGFLMGYPNWKSGIWIGLGFLGAMTLAAWAYTPYVKIGGRIYALTVDNSQPDPDVALTARDDRLDPNGALTARTTDRESDPAPDSYGGMLTRTAMWWLLVVIAVIAAGNAFGFAVGKGGGWAAAVAAGFLVCSRSSPVMATPAGAIASPAASTFSSAQRRLSPQVASRSRI